MEKNLRESVIEKVYQHARETKQSVLCIIDDTIASKTRPSSQAVHPMEAASRWPVEVFFRTTKGKLALDKYQLRSATGIRRF